jgi:hypothetical protein
VEKLPFQSRHAPITTRLISAGKRQFNVAATPFWFSEVCGGNARPEYGSSNVP